MAVKIGEAYYDVSPKLNRVAQEAMNAEINKATQRQANSNSKIIDDANRRSFEQEVKNVNYLNKLHETTAKQDKARFQESLSNIDKSITAQKSLDAQKQKSIAEVRKSETRAYVENVRRDNETERNRVRRVEQQRKDDNSSSFLRRKLAQEENKQSEGFFHATATHFRTLGTLARGFSIGSVVLSGFSFLSETIGAISAAAPIAAAGIALIPAAVAAAGVEALVLKSAFKGVGSAITDAFNPAKAKQFQKELAALTPAARSFVQNIAKAKGILPNIQQTFFSQKSLQAASSRVTFFFRGISGTMKQLVAANGNLFGRLLGVATSSKGTSQISTFLGNLAKLIKTITPGLTALGQGFLTFIVNVSKAITGGGINKFLIGFGKWLAQINTQKLFAAATTAAKAFWVVLKDLGGILSGIFKAMGGADHLGATFFKNIGGLLKTIDSFVNSGTGQQFLKELIGTLNALSKLSNTVLKSALQFLAGAFAALWPAIKPFAEQIGKIVKDLVPLGPLVGTVLAAGMRALTNVLKGLEPILKKVVDWLTKHPKEVEDFAKKILLVVAAYAALKKVIGVAKPVGDLVSALKGIPAPVLAAVAAFAIIAAAVIYTYKHSATFRTIVAQLKDNLDKLVKTLGFTKGAFKTWASAVKLVVMGFLIADVFVLNAAIFGLTKTIAGLKRAFDNMKHWILTGWDAVAKFFSKTFPGWFVTGFHAVESAFESLASYFARWYTRIARFFTATLPHFVTKVMPSWFVSFAHQVEGAFNSVAAFFVRWYSNVSGFFTRTIPKFFTKTVPSWFSGMAKSIMGVFTKLYKDIQHWWAVAYAGVRAWGNKFGSVWSSIVHGVGVIWNGFAAVIEAPVKVVVNAVYNRGIRGFWNAIAKPLHLPQLPALTFNDKPPAGAATPVWHGLYTGGHVNPAWGGPTQDNVPIRVSGGEYVLNAKSVKQIGVQNLDYMNKHGQMAYAAGGSVPAGASGQVGPTLSWLRSIAGRVPYVLGANGPNAFDCSSLVGNVWARLTGNARNRRYFVTGTEDNWLRHHGFAPGGAPGGFTVGLTSPPEHTVGILAGHRFEAAHTGTKMRFDDGAANAMAFAKVYHMIGLANSGSIGLPAVLARIAGLKGQMADYWQKPIKAAAAKTPYPAGSASSGFAGGLTRTPGTSSTNQIADVGRAFLQKKLDAAVATAAASFGDAGATNLTVGANASQLTQWIAQASKYVNIPASWIRGILTIIQRESGGNPRAINRTDSNARAGHPSQGLMQTIPSTFYANVPFSLRSRGILDPVANIAAAVNYIHKRYGTIFKVQQANPNLPPHGYRFGGVVPKVYDNGGILNPGQMGINLSNKPERVYTQAQEAALGGDTHVTVYVDGVQEKARHHVTKNNNLVAASLNRRSKL